MSSLSNTQKAIMQSNNNQASMPTPKAKHQELKMYKVRVRRPGDLGWSNYPAVSASQAKYRFYVDMEFPEPYGEIMFRLQVRRDGDVYHTSDSFKDNAKQRGIEFAYCGMRIEVDSRPGVIVGHNNSAGLDVIFDGVNRVANCHPLWRTAYFNKAGELIAEFPDNPENDK